MKRLIQDCFVHHFIHVEMRTSDIGTLEMDPNALGISMSRPAMKQYALHSTRLETYKRCPAFAENRAIDLCNAGKNDILGCLLLSMHIKRFMELCCVEGMCRRDSRAPTP